MKIAISLAVSVLTAVLILSCLPVQGEEQVYDSVIRLHVLAASDSAEDQAIKLQVRDRVLEIWKPLLQDTGDITEAAAVVEENLPVFTDAVQQYLDSMGIEQTVTVTFQREKYPTRTYDAFSLPAGEYLSLRVLLDGGEGQNWWCVLFPSVCSRFSVCSTEDAYLEAGFTPEQYRLITHTEEPKYQIRFRLLEVLMEWFGQEQKS